MKPVTVKIIWLDPESAGDLPLPTYHSDQASGMDVAAAVAEPVQLAPGEIKMIPTNFAVAIPPGFEIQVRPRSGLAIKHGVTVINSPGTIDADYRGEIKIILVNLSNEKVEISHGERVAQMVIAKHETISWEPVEQLDSSSRYAGGFGSTGKL